MHPKKNEFRVEKKCISNPLLKKKFPLFIAHYAQSGNLFVDQSEWSIVCGILREKHRVYSGWCWLQCSHITSFLSSFRLYFFLHVDAQSDEGENNGSRVCLHGSTLDSKFPETFKKKAKRKKLHDFRSKLFFCVCWMCWLVRPDAHLKVIQPFIKRFYTAIFYSSFLIAFLPFSYHEKEPTRHFFSYLAFCVRLPFIYSFTWQMWFKLYTNSLARSLARKKKIMLDFKGKNPALING